MTTPAISPLERLELQIQSCKKCSLSKGCMPLAGFSPNGAHASLAYVLAAPTKEMSLQAKLYEGIHGEYLLQLFQKSGIPLTEMFLTSIVKCSARNGKEPPQNVVDTCIQWFYQEIESVKPKYIFSAGATATRALLNIKKKTIKLEDYVGKEYPYGNDYSTVIPVYSVEYCLRHGYPTQQKMQGILGLYSQKVKR